MVATGQPVHEIEDELLEVGVHLGYPDVQVAAGPTSLIVTLSDGGASTLRSARGALPLDLAADVRLLRYQLVADEVGPAEALDRLAALAGRGARYPPWLALPSWLALAAGLSMILQPGWPNVAVSMVAVLAVLGLLRAAERFPALRTLLPTVAAFVVALLVFTAADLGLVEGPLRTVLPPLAVLLPGALIVTGVSELAAGHMQAGSSRLAYGGVQLGLFALGLLAAVTVLRVPSEQLLNVRVDGIGWWSAPVGLLLVCGGICLMEGVPLRMAGWVLLVLLLTFAAQVAGQQLGSIGVGAFLGATTASLGATVVELRRPSLARLVVFLPSFWLLVPGSLGLVGVTQLATDQGGAGQATLGVLGVVSAIVLGLLVGSALSRSVRHRRRTGPA